MLGLNFGNVFVEVFFGFVIFLKMNLVNFWMSVSWFKFGINEFFLYLVIVVVIFFVLLNIIIFGSWDEKIIKDGDI